MCETPQDLPRGESLPKTRGNPPLEGFVELNPSSRQPAPSVRLDAMTRERIEALEEDKRRLLEDVDRLQTQVDRLAPEVVYLSEALRSAEVNNLVSTILIAAGGGIISYATFVEGVGKLVAGLGAGLLGGGVLILLILNVRRWAGAPGDRLAGTWQREAQG